MARRFHKFPFTTTKIYNTATTINTTNKSNRASIPSIGKYTAIIAAFSRRKLMQQFLTVNLDRHRATINTTTTTLGKDSCVENLQQIFSAIT